jgi:hypothetical protein
MSGRRDEGRKKRKRRVLTKGVGERRGREGNSASFKQVFDTTCDEMLAKESCLGSVTHCKEA